MYDHWLAESSSRFCLTTFRVPLKKQPLSYGRNWDILWQLPSNSFMDMDNTKMEVGIQVMFYFCIYVLFTCVFICESHWPVYYDTYFLCVCMLLYSSKRLKQKNKNRKCWNASAFSHLFQLIKKVSLHCDIERKQMLTQINSDLHFLWIPQVATD